MNDRHILSQFSSSCTKTLIIYSKYFLYLVFQHKISFLKSSLREYPASGAEHFGLSESQVHLNGRELSQYEYLENRIAFL